MAVKTDKGIASKPASGAVVGETAPIGRGYNFTKHSKDKLFIGLAVLLVLICALAVWLVSNGNKNVVIGATTITPKQVNDLSGEISQYTKSNAHVSFGGSPHKVARDDLILNAALKNEANKYNVKVTQDDIDAAQVNQFRAYGSMSAYRSFVQSEGITELTRVNAENDAYKAKLKDKIIASKDVFVASINYDTPYVNNAPNPASLRAQAVKTMQTKFLPLFQQGKSAQEITAQADINPAKPAPQNNGSGNGVYFTSMPSTTYYSRGCTAAAPCFNDVKSKPISGLPPLVSTQSEIDKLNTVGQNTGVFNSEAGFVGVMRLVGKTNGSYNSWAQFQQSYDKKYAQNKLLASILLPGKAVALAINQWHHQLGSINHLAGTFLLPKASADASNCSQNSNHFVDLNIHAYNQTGGNLSGATVTETRPNANCPNSGGRYVDSQGGANHGPNGGSTNGNGLLSFNDNCYNSPPDWSQSGPSGNNLAWVHVFDSKGDDSTMIVGNSYNGLITEDNAIGKAITDSGIWSNGNLNIAGSLTIELHYRQVPPPTWTLAGDTTVDGQEGTVQVKPGTTHTFRHTVTNSGPATASYNWKAMDDSRGAFANNGLPHATANSVGSGSSAPSSLARQYSVPSNAQNGDTYCQRIDFTNGGGPNDNGYSNSTKACVKVNDNPTDCPGGSSNCVSFPSCNNLQMDHAAGVINTVTVSGTDKDGTYEVDPHAIDYPDGHSDHTDSKLNLSYNAISPTVSLTYNSFNTSRVKLTGPNTVNFNCYHATCGTPYVTDGQGPNGSVIAGQQFHIAVPITNDNNSAYKETIPSSIDNGAYRFSITEKGGSYVEHDTGFSLNPGETQTKTIDDAYTAPKSVTSVTYTFYPDMAPKGSLDPDHSPPDAVCSVTIPVYQQFNVQNADQNTDLKPTNENPTEADYYTTFDLTSASSEVTIPQVYISGGSTYTALGVAKDSYTANQTAGDYGPGTHKWTGNSPDTTVRAGPTTAGNQYCTRLSLDFTSGYIGPGGPTDILGKAGSYNQQKCDRIVNEPYFKVYDSDISAGGDFDRCTTNGGTLAGYADISDPAGATRGSTTQLSALALLKITGVASAKTSADITGSPTKLTFANDGGSVTGGGGDGTDPTNGQHAGGTTDAASAAAGTVQVDSTGNESPVLGGQFGGCRTLTNETAPASAIAAKNTSSNPVINDVSTLTPPPPAGSPNAHVYDNGSGSTKLTINGSTLGSGQNVSVFVNGDAYIAGNINYSNGWQAGKAPSFILHATGNIYIAPGVTQLSGLYIAQANPDGSAGKIYTCADSTGFAPASPGNLYNSCKNQLVVYGSFVADQINLMRSFGSLRDETPTPGSPGVGGIIGRTGDRSAVWSHAGKPPGADGTTDAGSCVQITEPAEPDSHTWKDNWLCIPNINVTDPTSTQPLTMVWVHDASSLDSVKVDHPYCTQWNASALPHRDPDSWNDNYLCLNKDIGLTFGTDPGSAGSNKVCLKIDEPADPDGQWSTGYYLCAPSSGPTQPTPNGPPFSCSNAGIVVDPKSCSGELFEYSPALYLSNGGGTTCPAGGCGGPLRLQSVTSLPPVL